jgi:hypothetical protein
LTDAIIAGKLPRRGHHAGWQAADAPGMVEALEPRLLLSVAAASPDFRIHDLAGSTTPAQSAGPVGMTPSQLRHAYAMDEVSFGSVAGNGAGQTIAIVDAYDDPDIVGDFNTFCQTFFAGQTQPTLTVVGQTGTSSLPGTDPAGPGNSWAVEISLDVEWAHVMAPMANILLVEANSDNDSDLYTAVSTAEKTSGVSVVSMSWGGGEVSGESSNDSYFTTSGVTFVASAGDTGGEVEYPAVSPNVLAVGGTTLNVDSSGNYLSESGWSDGGGGVSAYESQPSYQKGVVTQSSTKRAVPDVAADADPNTGAAIIDSWDFGTSTPWIQVGGTSLAAPLWAGLIAVVDQGRALSGLSTLDGPSQTLPRLYALPATDFHDITTGNNGYAAGVGYDLVTGRGTPIANLLVPDLAALKPVVVSSTPTGVSTSQVSSVTFTFSESMDTTSFSVAADVDSFVGPGGASVLSSITGFSWTNSTTLRVNFSATTAQGLYQMTIGPQILSAADDAPMSQSYTAAFRYDAIIIAPASSTPANNSVIAAPPASLTLQFNEAYSPSSIGTGNLSLSQGTVTGFQLVNAQTVQYNLSGVNNEGTFTVNIAAGAIQEVYGNPGVAYTGTFTIDLATQAFPTPLSAVNPAGGLIYQGSVSDTIVSSTDTDNYVISLAAGQTLTALVKPGTGLQPSVAITGPGGTVLGTAGGAAAGQNALLETVPVATAGTYTIAVAGAAGTTGAYTLTATLNAALETQANGGAGDNTQATAQDIDGSFAGLGGTASRGAVLGTSTGSAGALPTEVEPNNTIATANDASRNFVSYTGNVYQLGLTGTLISNSDTDWFNIGTLQVGETITISESGSYTSRGTLSDPYVYLYRAGSSQYVTRDDDSGDGTDALIYQFTVTTADTYYIEASSYRHRSSGTYTLGVLLQSVTTPPLTGGTVTGEGPGPNNTIGTATNASTSWRAIGYQSQTTASISSSSDVDYYKFQLTAGDLMTIQTHSTSTVATATWLYNSSGSVVALDDGNSTLNPDSWIFGYIVPTTGVYYLEAPGSAYLSSGQTDTGTYTEYVFLSTTTPPPAPSSGSEWYSVTFSANNVVTLGLANLSTGTININLVNSSGMILADSSGTATNLAQIISNFQVPASGTYYVQITGPTVTPYSLVITRNAAFVTEPNNSLAQAQDISAAGAVLGCLTASDGSDFYGIQLTAGQVWNFQTATPGAAPGQFANTLDPQIELYNPSGTLIASNENGAPGGTNASITYIAATTGEYKVEVLPAGATMGEYVLTAALQPVTLPAAATGLGATVISSTQVNLAWTDHAVNATGYYVQESPDNATWSTIATLGPTATNYDVTGLTPGTYYYFRVLAYNTAGNSPTPGLEQLAPIPGDINCDGLVDVADYDIWAANVGATNATWTQGDLNGDGLVDVADYDIWAANVGATASSSVSLATLATASPTTAPATAPSAAPATAIAATTVPTPVAVSSLSIDSIAPAIAPDLCPAARATQQAPPARAAGPIVAGILSERGYEFDVLARTAPLRHLHRAARTASVAIAGDLDPLDRYWLSLQSAIHNPQSVDPHATFRLS